jgi:hypothetical protein
MLNAAEGSAAQQPASLFDEIQRLFSSESGAPAPGVNRTHSTSPSGVFNRAGSSSFVLENKASSWSGHRDQQPLACAPRPRPPPTDLTAARVADLGGRTRRVQFVRGKDETCPVSTG